MDVLLRVGRITLMLDKQWLLNTDVPADYIEDHELQDWMWNKNVRMPKLRPKMHRQLPI